MNLVTSCLNKMLGFSDAVFILNEEQDKTLTPSI
jgi:hypothetical protein